MRKVLDKVKQENFCSIEDTMWLYKQKELLIDDENKCIKNLAFVKVDLLPRLIELATATDIAG